MIDCAVPSARFLEEMLTSLEISRAVPAAYTFWIIFFGILAVAFAWGPIRVLRPAFQFSELREEILKARDLANVADPNISVDLYPATWALALKLEKLKIDLPSLDLTDIHARMSTAKFLTELVAFSEMKDLASARKLRAPVEFDDNQD